MILKEETSFKIMAKGYKKINVVSLFADGRFIFQRHSCYFVLSFEGDTFLFACVFKKLPGSFH